MTEDKLQTLTRAFATLEEYRKAGKDPFELATELGIDRGFSPTELPMMRTAFESLVGRIVTNQQLLDMVLLIRRSTRTRCIYFGNGAPLLSDEELLAELSTVFGVPIPEARHSATTN